jgi:hypothetical protein
MSEGTKSTALKLADSVLVIAGVIIAAMVALWLFRVVVGVVLTVVKIGLFIAIVAGLGLLAMRLLRGRR